VIESVAIFSILAVSKDQKFSILPVSKDQKQVYSSTTVLSLTGTPGKGKSSNSDLCYIIAEISYIIHSYLSVT